MKKHPVAKKHTKAKKHPVRKGITTILLFLLLAVVITGAVIIAKAPSLDTADVVPEGYYTTVLDDEENVMTHLVGVEANRVYVELEDIPENLQNAFIAIEDERFYQHHGIDLRGIARAFVKGVKNGSFTEGASTITQQLLKNNVFTDWTAEDTFADRLQRKIQEQYLAICLEQKQSKEWILENYLNTINLGSGTWGVQAASKRYFDKDVSELTLSEAAVLAGITKSPTAYNPLLHPDKSQKRQQLVLSNMLEQGYITQEEYEEALADNVYERIETAHTENESDIFSYFEDALITAVVEDLMEEKGYSEEQAWDLVYRGGLTIYSTQDSSIQSICEEQVNNEELYTDDQQVSVVVMDERDGAVKALVGGRGDKQASLTYNRATDSVRQPGSTFKVIGEYAAALDSGAVTLGTSLDDAAYTYTNGTEIGNAYSEYKGQITVRQAISCSSNVVALKVFQNLGAGKVLSMVESLGITTLTDADAVESLAIGGTSGGVTNLEMTAAYTAIGAGGIYREPYYYYKVTDHDGTILLQSEAEAQRVLKETTAYLLTEAMEDVITDGTGTSAYFYGMPIAGKSGTTNDYRDLWFVGYSPYYCCGVWGGYDSNETQTSTRYVKTLWKNIMQEVHSNYLYKDFEVPDSVETAYICSKCGKLAVSGLCDDTLQGDMAYTESYAAGSAPTTYCDCHLEVSVCTTSGKVAGEYCPSDSVKTTVYLRSGSEDTADAPYVYPASQMETCDEHQSIWDRIWDSSPWGTDESADSAQSDGQDNSYEDSYPYDYSNQNNSGADNGNQENSGTGSDEDEQGGWMDHFFGDFFQ